MTILIELADADNNDRIDAMTDAQRHEWYIRIKESLSTLQCIGPTDKLKNAILAYEKSHGLI